MASKFGSWWQKIQRHPVRSIVITGVSLLGVLVLVALIGGYYFNWDWTGFGSYTPPTKESNFQRAKTLWDWSQLLVIPVVLAIGGFLLAQIQKSREEKATKQRTEAEQELARDNQRENALQDYIDKMSELLLKEKLRTSTEGDEVRKIARVRTLTVLPRLDSERKGIVVQFLHESSLIDKSLIIIDLTKAELTGAELSRINLKGAALAEADLEGAILAGAILAGADLRGANLEGAILSSADLEGADLTGATLANANLWKANLRGTILEEVDLIKADLSRADLANANLKGADLAGADLSEANLAGANLAGADLRGIGVVFADWVEAGIIMEVEGESDQEGTNLTGANLKGADLGEADLRGADLASADLEGANLTRAIITPEQLNKAKSLQGASMPDGSKHS